MSNPTYRRAPSDLICRVLNTYGPHGEIALAPSRNWLRCIEGARSMRAVSIPSAPMEGPKVVFAYELAVDRIVELEAEVAAAYQWQDELAQMLEERTPPMRPAEGEGAWWLFEQSRDSFRSVQYHVDKSIYDRTREREMRDG